MTKFEVAEIKAALEKVGIEKGDHLFIHSSMKSFGVPIDIGIRELPKQFFNDILEMVCEEGTVAVPTFNFDFCKGIPYNRQNTPSKGMGSFSEYVRCLNDSERSGHPIQSISIYGKQKEQFLLNDTYTAFESGSFFDLYLKQGAKVLLLGATFDTVSFIHSADEIVKPPYRFLKAFRSVYTDGNSSGEKEYGMLARDLEMNPDINKFHIEYVLNDNNKLKVANIGKGKIMSFLASDFVDVAVNCMTSNPYFFVKNGNSFEVYNVK